MRSRLGLYGALLAAAVFLGPARVWTQNGGVPPLNPYPQEANGEWSDVLTHSALVPCAGAAPRTMPTPMRLATWNIRAARSAPLESIAGELKAMQADIVAMQEVDVRVRRSGWVDQPVALSEALGFHYAFAASIKWQGGDYGLAVLSRWPLVDVRRLRFDTPGVAERRIVLEVTVCADGRPLRVFNHHADFRREPSQAGLAALAALVRPEVGRGVVVLGDFNNGPDTPGVHALLDAGLVDRGAAQNVRTSLEGRVDYLLLDEMLSSRTAATRVWMTSSSDHHAVLTDLAW